MNQPSYIGKQSILFAHPVSILSQASIVGPKEGEGPLKEEFDKIITDPLLGTDSWEEAESVLQKETLSLVLQKANLLPEQIRYIFAGDLLAQATASYFGTIDYQIPLFGLFGACSTIGEALSLGSMTVAGGFADLVIALTSSHFGSAEKEFRFPLGYGNQRPLCSSWTVTGCGAFLLSSSAGSVAITGITTGKVVDFGMKDSLNMGGCMAPAACDTIKQHFEDFHRLPEDYDKIITGDLGAVGKTILLKLLNDQGIDISAQYEDCGLLIYNRKEQDTNAGGSGCGCSATVLACSLIPKLRSGEYKRILFIPTGALLSKVCFNEGNTVPGIAHAVVIEHISL